MCLSVCVLSLNRSGQIDAEISKLPFVSCGSDFGSFFKEYAVLIAALSHVYAIQSESFRMVITRSSIFRAFATLFSVTFMSMSLRLYPLL